MCLSRLSGVLIRLVLPPLFAISNDWYIRPRYQRIFFNSPTVIPK